MSLVLIEGFDTYGSVSTMISGGWSQTQISTFGTGRSGAGKGQSLTVAAANTTTYLTTCNTRPLGTSMASGVVGVALQHTGTSTGDVILHFFNATAQATTFYVLFNAGIGRVELWLGPPGSSSLIAQSNSGSYLPLNWNYFEIKFVMGSSGNIEVRLNTSTSLLNKTGLALSGNSGLIDTLVFDQPVLMAQNFLLDDIYVINLQGTVNNTFLGDCVVCTTVPAGVGNTTQFASHSGANWTQVKETQLDGDTTYTAGSNVGSSDLFTVAPLWFQTAAPIFGLSVTVSCRKDDQGAANVASLLLSGAVLSNGITAVTNPAYETLSTLYDQDPETGLSWSRTKINSLQVGYTAVM